MPDALPIEKKPVVDLIDTKAPALSSTSDIPVIETKPDATNEGKPPETTAAPDEGKTPGESATPAGEETPASDEPKKPAKGVQKRLDDLTRQREEADRRAKAAEERLDRALKALEAKQQPPKEPEKPVEVQEEPEPQRPKRSEFSDPDAYDLAMDAYYEAKSERVSNRAVQKALAKVESEGREKAEAQARQSIIDAHVARVDKAKLAHPDWVEVAESEVEISVPMAAAIMQHEQGPEIQYFLGKNPAEASRIAKLPPPTQLLELGLIAATLKQTPSKPEPVAQPKPITAAPAPIKPATSGSAETTKPLEEMSMDEYANAWKQRPENQRRVPGARRSQ